MYQFPLWLEDDSKRYTTWLFLDCSISASLCPRTVQGWLPLGQALCRGAQVSAQLPAHHFNYDETGRGQMERGREGVFCSLV